MHYQGPGESFDYRSSSSSETMTMEVDASASHLEKPFLLKRNDSAHFDGLVVVSVTKRERWMWCHAVYSISLYDNKTSTKLHYAAPSLSLFEIS